MSQTTPNEVSQETKADYRNIILKVGEKTLQAEKTTTTFEIIRECRPKTNIPTKLVSKKIIDEQREMVDFNLVEITSSELDFYRTREIPSFLLKIEGKLYHSVIPKELTFVEPIIAGCHHCGKCKRLSAASDERGGCAKVRDRNIKKRLEKYPFITKGYETFNTLHENFIVLECKNFEDESSSKTCKPKEVCEPPSKTCKPKEVCKLSSKTCKPKEVRKKKEVSLPIWKQYIL